MLNPSTADATLDDPTVRRCMRFATDWGFSNLVVRNLFSLRATNPRDLLTADNPVGGSPGNLAMRRANSADVIVAAWGAFVPFDRVSVAQAALAADKLVCLGVTKNGQPRHPLYVSADCQPKPFRFVS